MRAIMQIERAEEVRLDRSRTQFGILLFLHALSAPGQWSANQQSISKRVMGAETLDARCLRGVCSDANGSRSIGALLE